MMCKKKKRISSAIAVLTFILFMIHPLLYRVSANSEWRYIEELNFYFSGDSGYWVMNLTGGNITLPGINPLLHPINQVEELNLTFFHVSTIHSGFNFFREDVLYETHLPEILPESALLAIDFIDSLTKEEALEAAWETSKMLSEEFYLSFSEARFLGENEFEFVSPIDSEVHIPKVSEVLPTSLGGFSDLITAEKLLEKDMSYISISISKKGNDYFNSILVGVIETSIALEDKFSINNVLPGSTAKKTSIYSNSSIVTFHLKHAYIKSIPQNSKTSYDVEEDLTLIENRLEANASIPNLELTYTYRRPILVPIREFNATILSEGQILEVRLMVSNLGETEAKNVNLLEEAWWSPEDFEMIDGVLNETFSSLAKDQTRSIEYRLRNRYSGSPKSIKIPQVKITSQSEGIGENASYTAYSNSQVIWLSRVSAPSLSVTIKNILPLTPTIRDEMRYDTEVLNNGSIVAEKVQIGGVDIGSIEPGQSYSREWRMKTEDDDDLVKAISKNVTWLYNEETFSVESPFLEISFDPTTSLKPTLMVRRNISLLSITEENLILMVNTEITNIGDILIDDIIFQSRLPDEATFIEGNVSYDSELHEVRNSTTNLEEDRHVTFHYNVTVPRRSVTIFPEASIEGTSKFLKSTFKSGINSYVNSLELTRTMVENETVVGVNASFTLKVQNWGDFPIYELTLNQPKPSVGSLINNSEINISKLDRADVFEASFTYSPIKAGVVEIDEAFAEGIVGGRINKAYINLTNVKVYRGLDVELNAPTSVTEDKPFRLDIDISSDIPEEIKDIEVTYFLPSELKAIGISNGINDSIVALPNNGSISLWIEIVSPKPQRTPLKLPFPQVLYSYKDSSLNYTNVFSGEFIEKDIAIKENLIERYGLAVLVVLAAALATVFYLKKSVASSSEKK